MFLIDMPQFATFFLSIAALLSLTDGGTNLWLHPLIFEFEEPMTLNCEVTDKTRAVAWWIIRRDREPKKISNQFILDFKKANHSHSGICECFDTYEDNGFLKYSRKVLVIESQCSKVKREEPTNEHSLEWIECLYRHVDFLNLDLHLECNGKNKKFSKRTSINGMIELRATHRLMDKCSLGIEDSKLSLHHENNQVDLEDNLIHENDYHQDCSSNGERLQIFFGGFFSGLGLITILYNVGKTMKRSRETHELILDLREDEDDDEIKLK